MKSGLVIYTFFDTAFPAMLLLRFGGPNIWPVDQG